MSVRQNQVQEQAIREVLMAFQSGGVNTWLLGGWGIDALLRHVSREHEDIDLIAALEDRKRVRMAVRSLADRIGGDTDVELHFFQKGVRAEVVYFYRLPEGLLVSDLDSSDPCIYAWPPESFPEETNGELFGMACRAITWEAQYVAKAGYSYYKKGCPLRDKDREDLDVIRKHLRPGAEDELRRYFPGIPRQAQGR